MARKSRRRMPAALARYWAKKRRGARKVRRKARKTVRRAVRRVRRRARRVRTVIVSGVRTMARRRRSRRRSSRRRSTGARGFAFLPPNAVPLVAGTAVGVVGGAWAYGKLSSMQGAIGDFFRANSFGPAAASIGVGTLAWFLLRRRARTLGSAIFAGSVGAAAATIVGGMISGGAGVRGYYPLNGYYPENNRLGMGNMADADLQGLNAFEDATA